MKYSVVIRREVVESFEIEVEAETPEQAEEEALIQTDHPDYSFDWSQTDTTVTAEVRRDNDDEETPEDEPFAALTELDRLARKYRGCGPV
jgi:hypothetical protein